MASEGKGAMGAAGFGLLALVAGMGRFADDCGRVAARGASHAASGVDDVARLGRYGDEAAGLGAAGRYGDELGAAGRYGDELGGGGAALLDDADPWRSLNPEGATRGGQGAARGTSRAGAYVDEGVAVAVAERLEHGRWVEHGLDAVDLALEFLPDEDPLADVFVGAVDVISPVSLSALGTDLSRSQASVVVVVVEYEEHEARPAVAHAVATTCRDAGRFCVIAVSSSGRVRAMAWSATEAAAQGVAGLIGRLQRAAQDDGGTFLYRPAPDPNELLLIEFRPHR